MIVFAIVLKKKTSVVKHRTERFTNLTFLIMIRDSVDSIVIRTDDFIRYVDTRLRIIFLKGFSMKM